MKLNIIQQKMKVQVDACYLALIQNDKMAVGRVVVKVSPMGSAFITPRFPINNMLPSDMVFVLDWCNEHGISALVFCYLHRPSIKFEGYAL